MVHPIAPFIALTALCATALAGEVDFTPHESFYLAEATKVPCVAFKNGSRDMSYSPPAKWTLNGGGRKVTLMSQEVTQAGAIMQSEPVIEPLPATEANVEAYAEMAPRYAPRESTKVTVTESGIMEMMICKHPLIEVTMTYALFGRSYTSNIVFMPFEQQRLSFQVTAPTADFPKVAKAFRASLFSLQGLDPEPERKAVAGKEAGGGVVEAKR